VRPWILPIALLAVGTVIAVGAGWGINLALGSVIGLGDGEQLRTVAAPRPASEVADRAGAAPPDSAAAPRASGRPAVSRQDYIDTIVRRNLFDHQNVGKGTAAPGDAAADLCLGDDCDTEMGDKSDLPVTLLGTMVVNPADYSSAMLRNDNSKEIGGYRIGDKILDATVTSIAPRMVLVQRADGKREYILLDAEETVAARSGAPAGSAEPAADGQIVKESETSFVIDRQLFDSSLQDLDALSRMARAIPHRDSGGNVDGFRLSGVRPNELLYNLGIRSGDVVHGVNGQPLTSIAEAMNAMSGLQRSSTFNFEITRRGQKMTMNYRVQ
jgi:type II secretion system protein C